MGNEILDYETFRALQSSGPIIANGKIISGRSCRKPDSCVITAHDATTGEELWRYNTGAGVFASPAVYMVNGEEFVTVASGGGDRGRRGGDLILSFALPPE